MNERLILFLLDHLGYANGTVHGVTTYLVSVVPRLVQAGHRAMLCVLSAPHVAAKRLQNVGYGALILSSEEVGPASAP